MMKKALKKFFRYQKTNVIKIFNQNIRIVE